MKLPQVLLSSLLVTLSGCSKKISVKPVNPKIEPVIETNMGKKEDSVIIKTDSVQIPPLEIDYYDYCIGCGRG